MDTVLDAYSLRMQAGEEPGDMLAEEARLTELGVNYPLNLMHSLYYMSSADFAAEDEMPASWRGPHVVNPREITL